MQTYFYARVCPLCIAGTLENESMLGFAQTHQGLCPWTLPPFEKGGPKLFHFSSASTIGLHIMMGWGEGCEQRDIGIGDGCKLYVHLWNSEDWSIMPEQDRFDPHFFEQLPDIYFSVLPSTGALICIKHGESGYYPSDWDTGDPARNRELADCNNQRLGVTAARQIAMEAGSMHGWDCPAADSKVMSKAELLEDSADPAKSTMRLY